MGWNQAGCTASGGGIGFAAGWGTPTPDGSRLNRQHQPPTADQAAAQSSNIVLSNGMLDPWSVFGALEDLNPSVVAVIIPDVGVGRGRNVTS